MELRDTETVKVGPVFQEAFSHCRWRKVFLKFLEEVDPGENLEYYKHSNFEKILTHVYSLIENRRGLGILVAYDIAAGICKHHSIVIDKVYIVGNGPKRAVKILGLKLKNQKIGNLLVKYVEVGEVIEAFDNHGFVMDEYMRSNKDGDTLESYLCKWQRMLR